ncbi:MAG: PKD domain-containing protein [Flavobacteriales bacterium]|nr:PKD domain-containing protein [Flavobacteriales bacterium]
MKRLFGLLFLYIFYFNAYSQITQDTINNPYWVEMMQNPSVNFFQTQRAFELYWSNKTIEKGSGYKPFKRWEYAKWQIIDSLGNIPAPGVLEAEVEKYLRQRGAMGGGFGSFSRGGALGSGTPTCQQTGNWLEIGPRYLPSNRTGQPNGLGRINSIGFHPTDSNIVYVGAPAGGLWRSYDGGNTWATNTDSLATLGVSSIAVDPNNPDTIYLGTGDRDASDSYGRGVFKSTDGGQTWNQTATGMGNRTVGKLYIDPRNTQILLAATDGGIYRSTNGGNNWTQVQTGNFKDLTLDAVNPDFAYACASSAKYYKSTDNGATWTNITTGLPSGKSRMAVAVTPADSNFVYAVVTNSSTFAGLYLSVDRGSSFTLMSDTPNIMDYSHLGTGTGGQAWYDLDIAADPLDKSILYVAGVNIFQSKDSGKTWKINAHWVGSGGAPEVHADNHVMEYQPATNTLFTGNDGGIYFTKDLGKNWTDISSGIGNAQVYRIGQSATNRDMLINGYQDNGTGLMENMSWFTTVGGDGMDCLIDPSDPTWSYSDLYYGDIRRSKNGSSQGTIGANGKNGITEQGAWVTPFVLMEGTPSTMFAGYKNVWRTTNVTAATTSAVTWTKISDNVAGSNSQNIIALENAPADPDILYVSRSGNVFYKSTNVSAATPTWTDLTSNLPNNANVMTIESHSTMKNRVWITQSNKVYQSDDGGSNWTNISSGLPNIPLLSLVFDSSSRLQGMYIGTYMGVFYKDTTMSSWQWYNDNMPINTRVNDIEIYYSPQGRDKSHVVCGTYGRGNWRSPLYDEDLEAPIAGMEYSSNKLCLGETLSLTDTSENLPTAWLWKFSPNTVSFVNGTDSCSQHPQVVFNAKGKYSVKFYAENCAGYDSLEMIDFVEVFSSIKAASCTPKTNNTTINAGFGTYSVSIDGKTVTSSGTRSEGEYLDMACQEIFTLKNDTSYFVDVTHGKSYKEYLKIYIDFNNNGNLEDAGELVVDAANGFTHHDTIQIPITAVTNTLIRMRVMGDYGTIQHSCDTLGYGQTEDYGVVLEALKPIPHFVIDTNSICQNGFVTLTDSSVGSIYKRRWYMSKYGTLTFKSDLDGPVTFNLPDTGYYYAELVLNDSIVSKRIDSIVYVKPIPKTNLGVINGSNTVCEGASVVLKNTTNYKTASFEWYRNGAKMNGLSDSIITLGNVVVADSGTLVSTVSLNGCSATSNSLKVKVNPTPKPKFVFNKADTCWSNNGFDMVNTSTLSSGTMSYKWSFDDGNTSTKTDVSHTYLDTGSRAIKLVVTSNFGCKDSISKNIHVWANPTANWQFNQQTQCLNENKYICTNLSSVPYGSIVKYHWDFGNGDTTNTPDATVSFSKAGKYDIIFTVTSNKGCSAVLPQRAIVAQSPTADIGLVQQNVCLADNLFDFTDNSLGGNIVSHQWTFGDGNTSTTADNLGYSYGNAGNYQVDLVVKTDSNCYDTATRMIDVYASPIAAFTINDTSQCEKGNNIIIANKTLSNGATIAATNWDFGNGNTSNNANPASFSYTAEGNYSIQMIVRSDKNCNDTATQNVRINASPKAQFSGGIICLGDTVQFQNSSTISTGRIVSNTWDFGDKITSSSLNPWHVYKKAGTYQIQLIVESALGCKDTLTDKTAALVYDKPTADFTYKKLASFDATTEMLFEENAQNANSWNWQILGISSGSGQSYQWQFTDTGTFAIMLWVENANGCRDTIIKQIFVFPDGELMVPTSFSPNNDGLNEVFKPYGVRFVKEFEMTIYNRWGEQIFNSIDPSIGWDGTYLGKQVPAGQYAITIKVLDFSNEKIIYNNTITILR